VACIPRFSAGPRRLKIAHFYKVRMKWGGKEGGNTGRGSRLVTEFKTYSNNFRQKRPEPTAVFADE